MRTIPTETSPSNRQRAEEKARLDGVTASKTLSLAEAQKLVHELLVYQIELEMQNEELRLKQDALDAAHSRSEHFKQTIIDSLPVYIAVIDRNGLITAINKPWRHFGHGNEITDEPKNGS